MKNFTTIALSLAAGLIAVPLFVGCASETVGGQQPVLRASDPGTIEGCSDIRGVCTLSEPMTCYEYCADPPSECEPVEVCTASYPAMCRTICGDPGIDPGDCGVVTSVEDEDGVVIVACIGGDPGTGGGSDGSEPGDPGTGGGSEPGEPGDPGGGGGSPPADPSDPVPL